MSESSTLLRSPRVGTQTAQDQSSLIHALLDLEEPAGLRAGELSLREERLDVGRGLAKCGLELDRRQWAGRGTCRHGGERAQHDRRAKSDGDLTEGDQAVVEQDRSRPPERRADRRKRGL